MSRGAKIAIGVGVVVLILYFLLASPYNRLVSLDEQVRQSQANVEVQLNR